MAVLEAGGVEAKQTGRASLSLKHIPQAETMSRDLRPSHPRKRPKMAKRYNPSKELTNRQAVLSGAGFFARLKPSFRRSENKVARSSAN